MFLVKFASTDVRQWWGILFTFPGASYDRQHVRGHFFALMHSGCAFPVYAWINFLDHFFMFHNEGGQEKVSQLSSIAKFIFDIFCLLQGDCESLPWALAFGSAGTVLRTRPFSGGPQAPSRVVGGPRNTACARH